MTVSVGKLVEDRQLETNVGVDLAAVVDTERAVTGLGFERRRTRAREGRSVTGDAHGE